MRQIMFRGCAVHESGTVRAVTELYATADEVKHWLAMYGTSGLEPGETHYRIRAELVNGSKIQY